MSACTRYNRRGGPCRASANYEVDVPSPSLISSYGVVVCYLHLSQTVDEAWAELQRHIEAGVLPEGSAVAVRRTEDAPRLKPLFERLADWTVPL